MTATSRNAYVITGPTSGIGRETAFEVAKLGLVLLVGRDGDRLGALQTSLQKTGGCAVPVVCDLSDLASVRRAAAEIVALGYPIAGLINNAGMIQQKPTQTAGGWDLTFATNHLGPFALTEALVPVMPDGANVVFVASSVEDPDRNPGKMVGYRGGRYISAQASARGEWRPGGSKIPGADAYATSKQCNLATAMALAREIPRLRFSAVTPGLILTTGLFATDDDRSNGGFSKILIPLLVPMLMPFLRFLSTPKRAARVVFQILTNASGNSGIYYDERGDPTVGSATVSNSAFQDRVVAETRALLAAAPT